MSQTQARGTDEPVQPGCAVNSTFNFTVGALAVLMALVIAYWVYTSWWK